MPSYSGKRTYEMTTKKWGGRNPNQRRDDRRPPLQNRIAGGSRPMVNPWENGVTPGMQSSLLGQGSFAQPISSSYLMNSGMNRGSFGAANYGGGFGTDANKLRHLDRMGGFDDQRGRGLLPSPSNAPLLGVAPPTAFVPPGRGTEFLQHRMGNPWDSSSSFRSGGGVPRGLNSGYYPSNRGRQDNNNSRKFLKAKRPPQNNTNNKSSSSSSTSTSRSGGSKESRGGGRTKGSTSSSKSPSKGEDKDRDSSSAHSKSGNNNKQGDLPVKRERLNKDEEEGEKEGAEEGKESVEGEEVKMEEEDGEKKDEEKTEDERKEKEKQEDPFPVEALYCHICELDSFSSKKGYIRHLQGITHAKMAEMFHAKNAATLELLNISAKLAEMRQRDKVLRRTGKKGQPVAKTTEQILVQKWLKVGSCCGTKYKSPFGLEEHKLSIHHLKAKFTPKPKDEEKEEKSDKTETEEGDTEEELKEVKKEIEEQFVEDCHDEVLNQSALIENAQKESEKNPITMENIPAYNPSVMMGLEYILKELRFRCRVCKGQGFKSLENHCQSHSHFDNIASHLNKIEDMKREEKRKQEEAEEEAKREQERLEKEKEEKVQKEKIEKEAKMEEEEREGGLSSDFITLDDCAKDKSDDEEMDEDAILLGEEEERIFNSKEEVDEEEEEEEEATGGNEDDDDDVLMEAEIFEEVGEKIDFDGDLKKQLENGDEDDQEEEEEAKEVEPPQKKPAGTPRGRRGRSRGRGRWAK